MRERTLFETERLLRPFEVAALLVTAALMCLFVSCAWQGADTVGRQVIVALAAAMWLVPFSLVVANVVRHGYPTIGSAVVSQAALAVPSFVAILRTKGTIRLVAAATLFVSASVIVFLGVWFRRMQAVCAKSVTPAADAVIICLGGGVKDGRPRPTLTSRLEVCRALALDAPSRTIVCTGARVVGEDVSEAEVMCSYLRAGGVSASQIIEENTARTTRENVERSVALVRAAGFAGELCVCSSDYHLLRAVREGRRCGVELMPVVAKTPWASRLEQWCREALTLAYHAHTTAADDGPCA